MTAKYGATASNDKTLIDAKSTVRLVSCATKEIAELLRPAWAEELRVPAGSENVVPAQLDRGGPVRNTQKSNAVHASGRLYSPKNRSLVGWESHLEKKAMTLLECDPTVPHYYAQPMTLRYELEGHQSHYTPDTFTWRYGQPHVFEVKPNYTASQAHNRILFALFDCFFRAFGITYCVLDETVIYVQPRLSNCSYLMRYHDETLSDTDIATITNHLRNEGLSVETLASHLDGPRPVDRVYAAILRGHARIDHRQKISASSLVLPV